jgi:hypothetical protein
MERFITSSYFARLRRCRTPNQLNADACFDCRDGFSFFSRLPSSVSQIRRRDTLFMLIDGIVLLEIFLGGLGWFTL